VAWCVQGDRVEVADREALAIAEQMVELAAVALELGPRIEDLAEDVLNNTDVLPMPSAPPSLFLM
jgi:hypothetical protein